MTKQKLKKVYIPITSELAGCLTKLRSELEGRIPGVTLSDSDVARAGIVMAAELVKVKEAGSE